MCWGVDTSQQRPSGSDRIDPFLSGPPGPLIPARDSDEVTIPVCPAKISPMISRTQCPIFIGGVPRSGTTLTRVILDTHPNIHCGTELRVVQAIANLSFAAEHGNAALLQAYHLDEARVRAIFAELILAFLRPAWANSGKPRIAEKTPSNLWAFPQLRRIFPESPLIHVIRDVRDVVTSRLERDRQSDPYADRVALAAERAREWTSAMRVRDAMLADPHLRQRYHELRYEDLVNTPEPTLRALFDFIDEPFDPKVLEFHSVARNVTGSEEWSAEDVRRPIFTDSTGQWATRLGRAELDAVLAVARDDLLRLGYSIDPSLQGSDSASQGIDSA